MVGSCWVCHWKKTFWVGGCDGIGGLAYLLFCAAYWSRQPRVFRRLSRSCLSRPYCIKRLHVRVTISSIYQGISVHFHCNPLPEQCLEDVISKLSVSCLHIEHVFVFHITTWIQNSVYKYILCCLKLIHYGQEWSYFKIFLKCYALLLSPPHYPFPPPTDHTPTLHIYPQKSTSHYRNQSM